MHFVVAFTDAEGSDVGNSVSGQSFIHPDEGEGVYTFQFTPKITTTDMEISVRLNDGLITESDIPSPFQVTAAPVDCQQQRSEGSRGAQSAFDPRRGNIHIHCWRAALGAPQGTLRSSSGVYICGPLGATNIYTTTAAGGPPGWPQGPPASSGY